MFVRFRFVLAFSLVAVPLRAEAQTASDAVAVAVKQLVTEIKREDPTVSLVVGTAQLGLPPDPQAAQKVLARQAERAEIARKAAAYAGLPFEKADPKKFNHVITVYNVELSG